MGDGADDAERRAQEELEQEGQPEVRSEEFSEGVGASIGEDAFTADVVGELERPLDPDRVRRRSGRGSGQYEYLAGHDVKRRATQIFGFGNWGHHVVSMVEIAAVPVVSENDRDGWHVGYRACVRIWVNSEGGRYETEGFGYGDGVEYTPAARVTACELAIKEAETDALKRAFTDLGDQFGLILYAKADEKSRIQREQGVEQTSGTRERRSRGAARSGGDGKTPRSWAEIHAWGEAYGEEIGWQEWERQASFLLFGTEVFLDLKSDQRTVLGQKASGAIIALREAHEPGTFPPVTRGEIQAAWASVLDGQVLPGPDWRLDPAEAFPTLEELRTAQSEEGEGPLGMSATSGEPLPEDDIPWPETGDTSNPAANALDTRSDTTA